MCGAFALAPMLDIGPLPNHVLSVLPLCIGWDAPGHAMRELRQRSRYLYAYDTDEVVKSVLEWLHGAETVALLHLGQSSETSHKLIGGHLSALML